MGAPRQIREWAVVDLNIYFLLVAAIEATVVAKAKVSVSCGSQGPGLSIMRCARAHKC